MRKAKAGKIGEQHHAENSYAAISVISAIVWLAVIASSIGVISSTHLARAAFNDLQKLKSEYIDLQEENAQLLIEKSTWSAEVWVGDVASTQLGMVPPEVSSIVLVKP